MPQKITAGKKNPGAATVLVVEDDANIRGFTESALDELGYTVDSCSTGGEALNKIQTARPGCS